MITTDGQFGIQIYPETRPASYFFSTESLSIFFKKKKGSLIFSSKNNREIWKNLKIVSFKGLRSCFTLDVE